MPDTRCWDDLKQILNLDLEGKKRRITFISGSMSDVLPAKKVKEVSKSYRNGAQKNLVQLGVVSENTNLIWKNAPYDLLVEQIVNSDIVYLLGGNPLSQIKFLKEQQLDKVLREYQGIIIGVSGGAMSLAKNILIPPCGEKYPEYAIEPGLAVSDINVMPHFNYAENPEKMETKDGYIYTSDLLKISHTYPIIGIPNQSIIRLAEDSLFSLGDNPYYINNGTISDIPVKEEYIDSLKIKKLILKK